MLGDYLINYLILELLHLVHPFLVQLASTHLEKLYRIILQLPLLFIVSLLYEVDEGLGTDELGKELLITLNVLLVCFEVEDVVSRPSKALIDLIR